MPSQVKPVLPVIGCACCLSSQILLLWNASKGRPGRRASEHRDGEWGHCNQASLMLGDGMTEWRVIESVSSRSNHA